MRDRMRGRKPASMLAATLCLLLLATAAAPGLLAQDEEGQGSLERLHVRETVEGTLATDGQLTDARLRTHTSATGHGRVEILDPTITEGLREPGRLRRPAVESGQTAWRPHLDGTASRETLATVDPEDVPVVVRVRYELDGQPVSAEELRGSTGRAAVRVQLRNPTAERRTVEVEIGDETLTRDVNVSLPLLAESRLELDGSWHNVTADHGRAVATSDGATTVEWSSALFTPFGHDVAEIEVRGDVDGASTPGLRVEATPVTSDTSDLLRLVANRAGDEGVADAVGAFLASTVGDGLAGAADGAGGLTDGLRAMRAQIGDAGDELDMDVDVDAMLADAMDDLAPDMDVDPEQLFADMFDPSDLPEMDLASALEALDPAALLGDADLDGIFEAVLADMFGDVGFEIDPDLLEQALRNQLDDLDLGLDGLLEQIGLGDVVDGDLPDDLLELDLGDLLATWLEGLDPQELLEQFEPDAALEDALRDLDLADLMAERLEQGTLGDLFGDTGIGTVLDLLAGPDGLELDTAAVLAPILDEYDLSVPGRSAEELDAVVGGLGRAIETVRALSGELAASEATDAAAGTADVAAGAPASEADDSTGPGDVAGHDLAEVVERITGMLEDAADALADRELTALADVDVHLADAAARLSDAEEVVSTMAAADDAATEELDLLTAALSDIDASVAAAVDRNATAREQVQDRLASASTTLATIAEDVSGLAIGNPTGVDEPTTDRAATPDAPPSPGEVVGDLEEGLAALERELAGLLEDVGGVIEELAGLGDLEDALLEGPALTLDDLLPEELAALLADLPLSELVDEFALSELLAELELELDPADLLGELELDGLSAWLREQDLTLAEFLDTLGIEPDELFGDLELPEFADLLDGLDLDLEQLLEDLGFDPADLAPDVDLEALFAEVVWPQLADALDGADLDALLAELMPDPAELFAGMEFPDLEELFGGLNLDLDGLLDELGFDDLGDLDELIDGLLAGLAELAEGSGEIAEGLAQLLEEGVRRLIDLLDDEALESRTDLALVGALEQRADEAQLTAPPAGAETSMGYRLVMDDTAPARGPLYAALGLLGLAGGLEVLRRRWTGV